MIEVPVYFLENGNGRRSRLGQPHIRTNISKTGKLLEKMFHGVQRVSVSHLRASPKLIESDKTINYRNSTKIVR